MSKISEIAIVDENEQSTTYEIQDAPLTARVVELENSLDDLGDLEIYVDGSSLVINTILVDGNEVSY